jgi:hypothetical protein
VSSSVLRALYDIIMTGLLYFMRNFAHRALKNGKNCVISLVAHFYFSECKKEPKNDRE